MSGRIGLTADGFVLTADGFRTIVNSRIPAGPAPMVRSPAPAPRNCIALPAPSARSPWANAGAILRTDIRATDPAKRVFLRMCVSFFVSPFADPKSQQRRCAHVPQHWMALPKNDSRIHDTDCDVGR